MENKYTYISFKISFDLKNKINKYAEENGKLKWKILETALEKFLKE